MKKQLLMAAIAAGVVGSAQAVIENRWVTNQTDYVIFVAWKNKILGLESKSTYIRLFPGEKYKFDAIERGYGITGAYGNTVQVELGERIGSGGEAQKAYKKKVNAQNKKLDPSPEAFVRPEGNYIKVLTSDEIAGG